MKRFTQNAALPLILSLLALASSGCREDGLVGVEGLLEFRPATLEFEPRYEGLSQEKSFVVANEGRANLELTWSDMAGAMDAGSVSVFTLLDPLPELLPAGETTIRVRFDAAHPPGRYEARIIASTKDGKKAVTLRAEIKEIPDCQAEEACRTFHFDTALERCVPTSKEDGIDCTSDNKCLTEGACHGGVCTGKSIVCDDGNACTVDVCDSQNGCMFFPGPPCPGDGKCMVGACNPESGCFMEPAVDGTSCGPLSSCVEADVCIEGTCVVRDPPDGFICAEASPCQERSICQNDGCITPPKKILTVDYSFDSRSQGGGNQYHDLALEPSGAMSLFGVFSQPLLRATTPTPVLLDGFARRCMMWNGRALCLDAGDAAQRTRQGNVSLVHPETGELLWSFSLSEARPDLVAGAGTLFMGRAAIAGTDRFAALFEAYRFESPTTPAEAQCRRYFLIVLNTSGQLVNAHEVTDPALELCIHPHPFGMAADVAGNFFISFSPSLPNSPGALVPDSPTLLMAFARDGTPKWRRNLDIRGGELAVGRGLLFPERSATPIRTSDGTDLPASAADFGRPGITAEHVLAAPRLGENWLEGRPLATAPAWTYTLPDHFAWSTDQLRLAAYKPRQTEAAETIIVSFAHSVLEEEQRPRLVGIRARDGQPQFMCEVEYSPWPVGTEGSPQLFEVGTSGISLMDGTPACGRCDPPYAGTSLGGPESHGRFFRFATPTLSPATAPWPGAFGGENHDHQENTLLQLPME